MKKIIQYLSVVLLLTAVTPTQLKAENTSVSISVNSFAHNTNEKATLARLKTIRELAKTNLSKSEKKALREEVLSIRESHRGPGGVIYISTGALILIIVLLIILL